MRQILIKSVLALTIGTVPGFAIAQNEMLKKRPSEQSEGQGGGQYGTEKGQGEEGGRNMEENGGQGGEKAPMKHEGQETKRPKGQSEELKEEHGGEKGQMKHEGQETKRPKGQEEQGGEEGGPAKNRTEEHGTKERHGERRHVNEEQRSELKRVFHEHRVEAVPNVNFSVDVGARVPREVHLHRLPPRILEIVPDYEGYMYFMLPDGRVAIVDPDSLEIVLIIA